MEFGERCFRWIWRWTGKFSIIGWRIAQILVSSSTNTRVSVYAHCSCACLMSNRRVECWWDVIPQLSCHEVAYITHSPPRALERMDSQALLCWVVRCSWRMFPCLWKHRTRLIWRQPMSNRLNCVLCAADTNSYSTISFVSISCEMLDEIDCESNHPIHRGNAPSSPPSNSINSTSLAAKVVPRIWNWASKRLSEWLSAKLMRAHSNWQHKTALNECHMPRS